MQRSKHSICMWDAVMLMCRVAKSQYLEFLMKYLWMLLLLLSRKQYNYFIFFFFFCIYTDISISIFLKCDKHVVQQLLIYILRWRWATLAFIRSCACVDLRLKSYVQPVFFFVLYQLQLQRFIILYLLRFKLLNAQLCSRASPSFCWQVVHGFAV